MTPIRLLERNPHYLEFRGRPTLLIGSGEHYGAVLNLDFDYVSYFQALQAAGLNLTRTFSGTYRELPGSHAIVENTLAPRPRRFICPWARHEGGKYDLTRWDEDYFRRLGDFVSQAGQRGIVVELVLFCFWYTDELWAASPMHASGNVNGVGVIGRHESYAVEGNPLLPHQEAIVRRIVTELNAHDNLYYEIMNEPYSRHDHTAFDDWQSRIAEVIAETESSLPHRHLIAQNVQNHTMRITDPNPAVSILNFHYARASAVGDNYHLGRVIADDETGFAGQGCRPYRQEAWNFLLAGGGVFSHLDYSFTTSHPDGTAPIRGQTPGYGGVELRRQLRVLKEFLEPMDFPAMSPHDECVNVLAGALPGGATARVLADPGRAYAVYVFGGGPRVDLGLSLAAGPYHAEWIHPCDGHVMHQETFDHEGGSKRLASPGYADDVALRVMRA